MHKAGSSLRELAAAQQVFFHGTVSKDAQAEADQTLSHGLKALRSAEESSTGEIYLGAIADIDQAQRRSDQQGLFDLAASLSRIT